MSPNELWHSLFDDLGVTPGTLNDRMHTALTQGITSSAIVPVSAGSPAVINQTYPFHVQSVSGFTFAEIASETTPVRWKNDSGTSKQLNMIAATVGMRKASINATTFATLSTALNFGTQSFIWDSWHAVTGPESDKNVAIQLGVTGNSYLFIETGGASTSERVFRVQLNINGSTVVSSATSSIDISNIFDYSNNVHHWAVAVTRTGNASARLRMYFNGLMINEITWNDTATAANGVSFIPGTNDGAIRLGMFNATIRSAMRFISQRMFVKASPSLQDIVSLYNKGPHAWPTNIVPRTYLHMNNNISWAVAGDPEITNNTGTVLVSLDQSLQVSPNIATRTGGSFPNEDNSTLIPLGQKTVVRLSGASNLNLFIPAMSQGRLTVRQAEPVT